MVALGLVEITIIYGTVYYNLEFILKEHLVYNMVNCSKKTHLRLESRLL